MMENNQAIQIDSRLLPNTGSAVKEYETLGEQLTIFNCFGEDPLQNSPTLVAHREADVLLAFLIFHLFFIM